MVDSEYLLITIPPSHYCEKARWALDYARIPYREERHPPLFHLALPGVLVKPDRGLLPDRIACVDLPAWPLQLLVRRHPDWRDLPAAVVAGMWVSGRKIRSRAVASRADR